MTTPIISPQYASFSRRFFAWILDVCILFIPATFAGALLPYIGGIFVWFLYGPILESSPLKATLGKQWMGIQVTGLNGEQLTFKTSCIRSAMKIISSAILFIGFIIALLSNRSQTLHDIIAETIVVFGREDLPVLETWAQHIRRVLKTFL